MVRNFYLSRLLNMRGNGLIKVLRGMRGVGKTTLLNDFTAALYADGVPDENILRVDFAARSYDERFDYTAMYNYLQARLNAGDNLYLLLDELPDASEFEWIVGSLYLNRRLDITITVSEGHIVSEELATVLSGGFDDIPVLPLSFAETDGDLIDYCHTVALPGAMTIADDYARQFFIDGNLSAILLKQVNRRRLRDASLPKDLLARLMYRLGQDVSAASLAADMRESGRSISVHTIMDYLDALTDSLLIDAVPRYDIPKETVQNTVTRYYLNDVGLAEFVLGIKKSNTIADMVLLENVIYCELVRRYGKAYMGRNGVRDIGFAVTSPEPQYFRLITAKEDIRREARYLLNIRDQWAKTLLVADDNTNDDDYKGVRIVSVRQWLTDTAQYR